MLEKVLQKRLIQKIFATVEDTPRLTTSMVILPGAVLVARKFGTILPVFSVTLI